MSGGGHLRTAVNHVIFTVAGISTVSASSTTGNISTSSAAGAFMNGFSMGWSSPAGLDERGRASRPPRSARRQIKDYMCL